MRNPDNELASRRTENARARVTVAPTLRVLHVTNAPFTIKQFLAGQTAYMHARGVEIHIAARPDGLAGDFDTDGIHAIHPVPIPRDVAPLGDLRAILALRNLISRLRPHIVHGHTPKGGLIAMIAASWTGIPGIYHCRGLPFSTASGVKRVALKSIERISLHLASRVLCISNSLRQLLLDEGLCMPDKISIPGRGGSGNGIDPKEFDPSRFCSARQTVRREYAIPEDALVIGFVGRLIREKGIQELVTAFRSLKQRFPLLHLLVVGPFDERDPVSTEVRQALIDSPDIHLTGYQAKTAPFYAAMDVFAFPTYREGFGVVALEAGAMRLPVVASRVTGCVDSIIDGTTGTLVEARSAPALANGLIPYLESAELRALHGCNARRHVLERFRQELIWDDILDVYHEVSARPLKTTIPNA